jgi:hypothetical protein
MPEETWALVEERAPTTPGRDRSGYIANLVDEDLRSAGLMPSDERAEILAVIEEVGIERALEILRRANRKQPRESAAR